MKLWLKKIFGGSVERSIPLHEIRRSFDEAAGDEEHFPATIDPRIYHVQLILDYFGDLSGKRILDAGCGKGRFARVLKERYPAAQIAALDLSEAMLRFVPAPISACSGTMTALPFGSASFDCVYATESLEHAVDIGTAVGEMCRILKPGGKLVIIDKNAEHWGRLKTPEWEKWFRREELEKLLKRDCREVASRFISYWEDVEPDGLFLAWLAQK
ncbi:MAG: methyltransferase domain-containing protein [Bryobacterales bacterium]|nr:methyltransferase domain-containing protein [Bryobacterales bacterium]